MPAREAFVSLASLLLHADEMPEPVAERAPETEPEPPVSTHGDIDDALRDARLFRASLCEAVDAAVETLIGDIAADVLARELQLAPVDIDGVVDRALARYLADDPIRVRVHPDDVAAISGSGIAVVTDIALRRGDAVLELRSGTVDASLGARLDEILCRMAQ